MESAVHPLNTWGPIKKQNQQNTLKQKVTTRMSLKNMTGRYSTLVSNGLLLSLLSFSIREMGRRVFAYLEFSRLENHKSE